MLSVFPLVLALVALLSGARPIDLVPASPTVARVAVAFSDGITQAKAEAFVKRSGYEVLEVRFTPVIVWVALDEPLSGDQVRRARQTRGVLSVEQEDAGAQRKRLNAAMEARDVIDFRPLSVRDPMFSAVSVSHHNVTLVLEPWVSTSGAENVLRGIADTYVRKVTKWPNTITIQLNVTWGTDAVRWLEAQAEVADVSFLPGR